MLQQNKRSALRFFCLATLAIVASNMTAGCMRLAAPPSLHEAVVIRIETNKARLATSQVFLTDTLSPRLQSELGWRVNPSGTASLTISLRQERIDDSAVGDLGVPQRWDILLRGKWTLETTQWGSLSGTFSGKGSADTIDGEARALQQASNAASNQIIAGLDSALSRRQQEQPLANKAFEETTTAAPEQAPPLPRRPNDG